MNFLGVVIIVEWALTIAAGVVFLAVLGPPWRSMDREMKWHLAWAAIVAVLQPIGLLLGPLSLLFPAITEGLSAGIMVWRLWLLIQTRRRANAGRGSGRIPVVSPDPPDTQ